jgi:aminodeoxyfutalosine synthase
MSLFKIEKKVLAGKRLSPDDALALLNSNDLFTIGRLAGHVSIKKNGNRAFFIQNHHINPTNICVNRCKFCAFSRSKGEKGAYELSIKDIIKKLRVQTRIPASNDRRTTDNGSRSFSEVHIVGGLHPDRSFEYYCDMLSSIKNTFPSLHIKAFTAVEIDYFSRISGLSIGDTLLALKNAGLGSMPGGGAEIFNTRVRNRICPEKISGRRWLQVMETAHTIGIKSNATMLYGHLETNRHRVEHMLKLRDLQDRTAGFQAFIPLAFHPLNTNIDGAAYTSGIDDIMTIAVSRLFLDNIPHIKAYWIMLGEKIAQLALLFGADDLDGTIIEEKITHAAGGLSEHALTKHALVTLIRKTGKEPVERDSYYNAVQQPTEAKPR